MPVSGSKTGLSPRLLADKHRLMVKAEYDNGWRDHHRDIADYIQPRRARFLISDHVTAGSKKNDKILNNVATEASDTLRAGLVSGTCSSARPWFKLTTHDPAIAEISAVKDWLHEAEQRIIGVLARSNFYLRVEEFFGDLGDFGTAALHIEADDEGDEVIRCYVYPIGSYYIAQSARQQVDTVYRDIPMTVKQLVDKFGLEKCCKQVQIAFERAELFQYFDVYHFIKPNEEYVEGAIGPKGKKYVSVWYEANRRMDEGFLSESGYDYFPVMVTRWKVTGTDVWGSSPGMNALGDVKGLQHLEEKKMGMVDKLVDPPMNVPVRMRGQQASLLPGALNFTAGAEGGMTPAVTINPAGLSAVIELIREHEARIKGSYHADLFRLLEQYEAGQMTAYEVSQRIQEKMQLLGPAYERSEEELLDPAMDAIISILFEGFYLPEVPAELQGQELKVEYTSIVAQALKASGTGAIRELLQFVGNLVAVDADVIDNIDMDKVVMEYANMLGISPKLLRDPKVVQSIRDAKAQAAQKQQAMQQAGQMAAGAKVLSETNTDGKNALTDLIGPAGRGPV